MKLAPSFYTFVPIIRRDGPALVLLHGSGGREQDLLPLAKALSPGSPVVAIRGSVEIEGGFAFFHRKPDRSIDEADISTRTPLLAAFVTTAVARHDFSPAPIVIGFSNGAIMAAALLLTQPTLFSGAILFRPLSPFVQDPEAQLNGKPVLIMDGEKDSRRSPGDGTRLAERLSRAGASITHHVLPVGHSITALDEQIARDWLAAQR